MSKSSILSLFTVIFHEVTNKPLGDNQDPETTQNQTGKNLDQAGLSAIAKGNQREEVARIWEI